VDDPRQLAAAIGLEHATPDVLDQSPLAAAIARKYSSTLETFLLALEDEPAVVFKPEDTRDR
jgi:hypothetical protein